MARLHEYQGKRVLASMGVRVPRGRAADSPQQAAAAAKDINGPVVVKVQAWTTSRAAQGGIKFADTPEQAAAHAGTMLAMTFGQFPVTHVLVEEKIAIAGELFVSLSINDKERRPILLLASGGGSGIEERADSVKRIPCDVDTGPDAAALKRALTELQITGDTAARVADAVNAAFKTAATCEARSVEINPLAILKDGSVVAADCRITIDDYAVARHPELGIDIARELDHPPTPLERTAYDIEQADHRGTFFFAQMNTAAGGSADGGSGPPGRSPGGSGPPGPIQGGSVPPGPIRAGPEVRPTKGLIGFHGAGGGGSMMAMDAITNEGFTIANFCDTSGNPSPAKVYRAARVILSQPGLTGYFGSGSGVANQEQFWSAYGLAKAFVEMNLDIPAVIRLGGNTEDRAVDILQSVCKGLPAKIEGYKKNDTPAKIAARFAVLVAEHQAKGGKPWTPRPPRVPPFVGAKSSHSFEVKGGKVWIDAAAWKHHAPAIIARANGLLKDHAGTPAITVKPEELLAKDSDLIACEIECLRDGFPGLFVKLDIPGLDARCGAT